jgi:hypothetical protein
MTRSLGAVVRLTCKARHELEAHVRC